MELVGPILIMLMVGALVFFLIEVFYRGPHALRLGWVLGLFTAASVLVSRISIAEGLERAAIFGFALSAATIYVTVSLVDFEYGNLFFLEPVVVTLLVAVVMWSSNRLTWDCTVIDSSRDVSSIGLAEVIRRSLFGQKSAKSGAASEAESDPESVSSDASDVRKSAPNNEESRSGFQRMLFLFFANAKNQNTPGLWVFYFAVAAFPIFGFGQWFSRASEDWGYRWIFMLFAVYLASALGLLMLTSLLGLERYLRKRGAEMPDSISRAWMVVGTVFALAVMLVMLLLPSPSISNGLQDALGFLTTNSKATSEHAVGKDGQDEGEKPKGEKQDQNGKGEKERPGEKGAGDGDKGQGGDKKSDQKGNDSSGDKKSNQKNDSKKSNSDEKKQGEKSQTKNDDKGSNDKSKGDPEKRDDKGEPQANDGEKKTDAEKDAEKKKENGGNQPPQRNDDKREKQNANNAGKQKNAQPPPQSPKSSSSGVAKFIGTLMKYVVYIGGLLAVVILGWLFRDELKKLWREFFGKSKTESNEDSEDVASLTKTAKSKMNFTQFSNPFTSGFAEKWPATVTLQYSFEALEAWGRGHHIER